MHQIRSISLHSYLEAASSLGIDGLSLLAEAEIPVPELDRPEGRLPAAAVVNLLERSALLSGCDSFGVRMAQHRTFASLGALSLLIERLDDIGQVLETLSDFRRSLSDVLIVSTQVTSGSAIAIYDVISPFGERQALDLTIALGYLALTGASHGRWSPETVHFMHSAPRDRETFDQFFQAPLVFESTFNGFSFAEAGLRIPLPLADPAMARNARALLQSVIIPPTNAPMSDHTKNAIQLLLPTGRASIEEVSRKLGTTKRALQRHLLLEGSTFADLLDEVRLDLARNYLLHSSQSITSISESVGYANPSSFTRWFERELGVAPSHWRIANAGTAGRSARPQRRH